MLFCDGEAVLYVEVGYVVQSQPLLAQLSQLASR